MSVAFHIEVIHRDTFLCHRGIEDVSGALVCRLHPLDFSCSPSLDCLRLLQRSAVHIKSTIQEGLTTLLNLLVREGLQPTLRAIHLVASHINITFGRDATLIVGHLDLLAEYLLCLLDGLAYGHTEPEVYLLARRILNVLYQLLPV